MKKLIVLVALVLSATAALGNVAERVEGKLINKRLVTAHETYQLTSLVAGAQECASGIFTIVEDTFGGSDTYSLINVDSCFKTVRPIFCPEVYMPVCAANGEEERTYSNTCFMNGSGAKFVHLGECGTLE
ncbi:hypothetical protein A9Q84_17120 [Halobacteriovorax marinus]|uniref:Kazal-like domain-containing protein n=1 Tax=Halobacteriovorax marinus TaxID=97084 RepID=A0A1Y5F3X1_9BACT|nr:hypothetical protein A9Q84_17120 [Halobacteriovorax marinus]